MTDHAYADIHIAIAVATRDRPVMLENCLASFRGMDVPAGVTISFLVVENSDILTMTPVVDCFARDLEAPHSVTLLHEPELGIPFARNRALDVAAERQCRWLVFVDDDETVDPRWLSNLLSGAEANNYDLAAGPVVPVRPEGALTGKQRAIYDQYVSDAHRRLEARNKRIAEGQEDDFDLETNNWIGRISALQRAGLRFDESMRHTGGTDTDLSRRARRSGLKLGWVSEAVVFEVLPHARLSLGYVYHRSRSQTLTKYHIRYRKQGRRGILRPLAMATQKAVLGVARLVIGIGAGTGMQVKAVRTLGVAVGYFEGIFGKSSEFYVQTGGH